MGRAGPHVEPKLVPYDPRHMTRAQYWKKVEAYIKAMKAYAKLVGIRIAK